MTAEPYKPETMWAIAYTRSWGSGIYTGTFLTRKQAINSHEKYIGESWKRMYRRGDRAVRVRVEVIS
jgi:hypothetical protein